MAVLPRFDTPARLPEPSAADSTAWHARVQADVSEQAALFRQFFDPTVTDPGEKRWRR